MKISKIPIDWVEKITCDCGGTMHRLKCMPPQARCRKCNKVEKLPEKIEENWR